MITAFLPATSPMMFISSVLSSLPTRRFSTMASGAPSFSAKLRAFLAKPSSLTTTMSSSCLSLMYRPRMSTAVSSSTGMEKKPWIWPWWRSMVRTRSAPATVSMSAMSRAVMGTRGWSFLSERP